MQSHGYHRFVLEVNTVYEKPDLSVFGPQWALPGDGESQLVLESGKALEEVLTTPLGREATPSAAIVDAQSVKTILVKGERRSALRRLG